MKKIFILTLFPNILKEFTKYSIIKRAIEKEVIDIKIINIRNFSKLKHNQIDDSPYGGGHGMVLMPNPIVDAINSVKTNKSKIILLSPQGKKFNHELATSFSKKDNDLIIICGHYEGFDERIRKYIDIEISIGDYVLTGGEISAMVVSDAIIRLLPNVINSESHLSDSFSNDGLLDYPVYTRPYEFNGDKVPDILKNGNHKLINEWKKYHKLKNTFLKRPDLLKQKNLTIKEKEILINIKKEIKKNNGG